MNELEVIIGILDRIGAPYDVCADGTLEIYGGGNRSINLEFDERNQVVEIILKKLLTNNKIYVIIIIQNKERGNHNESSYDS